MIAQQPATMNTKTYKHADCTATKPLRILLLISNLKIGGAQEVVRTLCDYFPEKGYQTVVCTFEDGPLRQEIEQAGIPVEILPARKHSVVALPLFFLDMLRIRKAIASIVDRYQINVLQTQMLRSLDFLVLTLRPGRKLLVFWTFHNALFVLRPEHLPRFPWLLGFKRWAHSQLYRWTARWVNGMIVVSDDVKKALHAYAGTLQGKVSVIPNSVNTQRYGATGSNNGVANLTDERDRIRAELGLTPQQRVFAVVATFKKQKGHRFLIEAAANLIKKFPQICLLFIGDGELREELEIQTKSLGLDEHIRFLGLRSDVPLLLKASDYFVLPSLWEGLPVALIEAMASGLPVIATQVSGTKEVMLHNQTGLLVPPGEVEPLRKAMLYFLLHPDQAREIGSAARRRVIENFSGEQQANAYLSIYQEQWQKFNYPRQEEQPPAFPSEI
jgi:glycosyltransferase involved in cell wall biosynthesis